MFSLPVVLKTQFRSIRLSLGLYDRNGVVPSSQWYTMLIACTHYNAILSGTLGLTNSDVACHHLGYFGGARPTSYRTSNSTG